MLVGSICAANGPKKEELTFLTSLFEQFSGINTLYLSNSRGYKDKRIS